MRTSVAGLLVVVAIGLGMMGADAVAAPYPILLDDFTNALPINPRLTGGFLQRIQIDTPAAGFPLAFPVPQPPPPAFSAADWANQVALSGVYNHGTPSVPGNRDLRLIGGPGAQAPEVFVGKALINNKILTYSNDDGVLSTLDILYGTYTTDGNPLNIDANWGIHSTFFYFTLLRCDQNGTVTVQFTTHSEGGTKVFQTPPIPLAYIPSGNPAIVQQLPMSLFAQVPGGAQPTPADVNDIDGVAYRFAGPASWDMSIRELGLTIPEPTTLALLGLGALALARRRRKS